MDQQILNQIENIINHSLLEQEKRLEKRFTTKDDVKSFTTRDDLKHFATKDDLKHFATKDDLKNFATKDDLENMGTRITEELSDVINGFGVSIGERKATKEEIALLEARVTQVEQKITA